MSGTARYRYGSGTPLPSNNPPAASSGSSLDVNQRLQQLRDEHRRRQRNIRTAGHQTANWDPYQPTYPSTSLSNGPSVIPFDRDTSVPNNVRRRTPGPKAPDSWQSLLADEEVTRSDMTLWANGRVWDRERRQQVYANWVEQVLVGRARLARSILPVSSLEVTGVSSLTAYCLSTLAAFVNPYEQTNQGGWVKESSWLVCADIKDLLGARFRLGLMSHAAWTQQSGWEGMFDLFEAEYEEDQTHSEEDEWDRSSASDSTKDPAPEALSILDLSFCPMPPTAQRRFRSVFTKHLNLTNLTSISFAGSGMTLEEVSDLLFPTSRARASAHTQGVMGLKLKDLSLAGLSAVDRTGFQQVLVRISTSYIGLEFLDLSYMHTFAPFVQEKFVDIFLEPISSGPDREPVDERPKFPALRVLALQGIVDTPPSERLTIDSNNTFLDKRKLVFDKMRRIRKGKYTDIIT